MKTTTERVVANLRSRGVKVLERTGDDVPDEPMKMAHSPF